MTKLYLASKSYSRQYLLNQARIPFEIIAQSADETKCDWTLPIHKLVSEIARLKMQHAFVPGDCSEEIAYIVTADTLCMDSAGALHGKPINYEDAVSKVKKLRDGATIVTSFCLDKRVLEKNGTGAWKTIASLQKTVEAHCVFVVPDDWIEIYFKEHPIALQAAGALAIEEYGLQFLSSMKGSYSTIIGLPLYELRQALYELDFFND